MPYVQRSGEIKVLVVDDSFVYREFMAMGLSADPSIQVVATAENPFEARDKIVQWEPDVMICDIEMPLMNGIEFISRLLPQYPIPVIVVSTVGEAALEALQAGAVEFVAKPAAHRLSDFLAELIGKVKIAAGANADPGKKGEGAALAGDIRPSAASSFKVVAIGASTGGTEAISRILHKLPKSFPGIVIVQHIPAVFSRIFAERLNDTLPLSVKEAQSGDFIIPGQVLIAPGDRHMEVKRWGQHLQVECYTGERVNGHCPSIDVMFQSVAAASGKQAVGVLLTGMGSDGANGLLAMRKQGARTVGQDERTSVVYGIPKVAYEIGAVERQIGLGQIPAALLQLLAEKE
ncbi:protein-glutamate methylesterase/protein-glutamine glutaminase [Paenibacillus thalictri]|uniref:Protein-glutamate methylesterase/protein-glutamine glutaminase n=1 Tax=Paenibacillus thalictri TaxID=2527873 RepID=A0A4V2J4P1_9BACL|nr:chemotaxis response regulator protein-glutamate methylesterase [Paenibacillus thalictri]TBL80622.1 chemotaxis response regulator protein-glutamate methylesterase [Paenibacillus thalictri]